MARVRLPPGRSVPHIREALLKGTLTRLRPGAKAMSRHTSLQRTAPQRPECHHPFSSLNRSQSDARTAEKHTVEKSLFSDYAPPVPETFYEKSLALTLVL
jgi:hypothetical protein